MTSKIYELLGDFDPSSSAPTIAPVPEIAHRPRFSVMIPTFNCTQYLGETLKSVLSQDLGPELMQIEVIDDCSTKDDPESVVRQVGKGRVSFHRKERNAGATENFNTCIERSRGELVHILHGDDWVLPGFYACVDSRMKESTKAGMAIVRSFLTDELGEIDHLAPRAATSKDLQFEFDGHLWVNHFWTPGLVFRRSTFEGLGGFRQDLPHVADWEMIVRTYQAYGAIYINKPLACYRFFAANDTGKLAAEGKNLIDMLRFALIVQAQKKDFNIDSFIRHVSSLAIAQAEKFRKDGNESAFLANQKLAAALIPIKTKKIQVREMFIRLKTDVAWQLRAIRNLIR